jgi:G3E family GTPase
MATRGQFGDLFGAVNAFFTGLAFAGVIFTIFLQRRELETTTRLSVIATLVDAYTSQIDTMEQGKFRGYLWHVDFMLKSFADPLSDEEDKIQRYIAEKPIDPDFPRSTEFSSTHEALDNPVFRHSYKEWVRTRKQRDQLLKTLELEFEKVEGARQDASGKAKLPSALDA